MNCYSRLFDTPATLSDYLSKKISSGQATRRAQVSLMRDPMRRTRDQRKERKVEKTEGRSRNDRKILMLDVLHYMPCMSAEFDLVLVKLTSTSFL